MLTIIRRTGKDIMLLLAAVTLFAGCTPPGARALLNGKKLLDQGQFQLAMNELRTATVLLGNTNAQAFNYLGLACHHAGQLAEAERAYRRAFVLDPDLAEAHYNLGCLLLAENRLEQAKTELTAYALRRGNSVEGWRRLGTVQVRCRDFISAEKSFAEVLRFAPQDPEALTGMGIIRLQHNRSPREATEFFARALKAQPEYPPALLSLAVVAQEHLKDRPLALRTYREYLSVKPPPENAEAVKTIVRQLEQELSPPPRAIVVSNAEPRAMLTPPRSPLLDPARTAAPPKVVVAESAHSATPPPKPEHTNNIVKIAPLTNSVAPSLPVAVVPQTNFEMVKVASDPVFKPAEDVSFPAVTTAAAPDTPGPEPKTDSPPAAKTAKRGFFQKINPINLFSGDAKPAAQPKPAAVLTAAPSEQDIKYADALLSNLPANAFARYSYRSSVALERGDRVAAETAFAHGIHAQQAQDLTAAIAAYRQATDADPSFFDAQYNLGLAAFRQGDLRLALVADENALAILPDSDEARYNFALALKQANYPVDAALQLEKLLAQYPNNSRGHLALGNLYAQQLQQPARARVHYKKVLEIDPRNSQAPAVRDWLTAHPK